MNNQLTAPQAPVTDEELDQMIWKLERDGMTPKLLSLMRELRELRKAKVVVPEILPCPVFLDPGLKFGKGVHTQCMLDALNRRAEYHAELDAMTPEQRAEHDAGIAEFKTMLGGGFRDLSQPVDLQVAEYEEIIDQAIPDNSFTNEELEAMVHGNNPQANAYRELLARRNSPTTPDGWIPVSERMPDPKSEARVCVYTPTPHEDLRYRFVPASLFKTVCRDASHWHYMTAPAAPKEVG